MDEPRHDDAVGLPFPGPHGPQHQPEALPVDFQPLRLVCQPGGSVIELDSTDVIVGRHSEADIRLPLADVSRRHCRFVFGNGKWTVMDLNSLNGVYVNDEPVGQATLKQGDRVRIGGFVFAIDLSTECLHAAKPGIDSRLAQNIFHPRLIRPTYRPHRHAS